MRYVALLLILVGCVGCANFGVHGLDRPDDVASARVEISLVDRFPDGNWLGASWAHRVPQEIKIKRGMTETMTHRVVAHELMHAVGYGSHIPKGGVRCYSNPGGNVYYPLEEPCPAEIVRVRAVSGQYLIFVLDTELMDAVVWAIAMWNTAADREVFVLSP